MPSLSCRVALYSHDTMGLGHMRRNLLLAQALKRSPLRAVVLMIAGAREAALLTSAAGVDCVALPSLRKDADGHYHPRHLEIPLQQLLALRGKTTRAALEAFDPDVLIVDNVPRGAVRELDPVLESLRAKRRTRLVLGLRDVLDDPITLQSQWAHAQNQDAVRLYYDAIWVYGDPVVYDTVREYAFAPDVAAKVRYTGYLDQRARLSVAGFKGKDAVAALGLPLGRLALGLVEVLHPADLSPAALSAWLARGPAPVPPARGRIDLNGLDRIPRLLRELLGDGPRLPPRRRSRAEVHHAA